LERGAIYICCGGVINEHFNAGVFSFHAKKGVFRKNKARLENISESGFGLALPQIILAAIVVGVRRIFPDGIKQIYITGGKYPEVT